MTDSRTFTVWFTIHLDGGPGDIEEETRLMEAARRVAETLGHESRSPRPRSAPPATSATRLRWPPQRRSSTPSLRLRRWTVTRCMRPPRAAARHRA